MTCTGKRGEFTMSLLRKAMLLSFAMAPALSVGQPMQADDYVDAEFKASRALEAIRAQYAYARGYTGQGVILAVVDSGLDVNHPEFSGRVSSWLRNFIPDYGAADLSDLEADGNISGHGTHVAGLAGAARDGIGMHGVAYNATVLPLRTSFEGDELDAAYAHAVAAGAKVLNGSYGPITTPIYIQDDDGDWILNPHYQQLDYNVWTVQEAQESYRHARLAADADIVMVYAAGNEYEDQPVASRTPSGPAVLPLVTPANTRAGTIYRFIDTTETADLEDPSTWDFSDLDSPALAGMDFSDLNGTLIAVVATDRLGRISEYSNHCGQARQWCVAAPGGDFETPGFPDPLGRLYSTFPHGIYRELAGTSMAAPVVAGASAVLREAFPYMTARQIIEVMLTTADGSGPVWSDAAIYGHGMLDLGRAVNGPAVFGESGFAPVFSVDTQGYDSTWSNDISGSGGLRKSGAGTLAMTGASDYTGATDVTGGKLIVDGSIARSSLLTIGGEANLGGSGTVGTTEVYGKVTPGNSIGTLAVAGDYTQHAGSVLEVELDQHGLSDKLVVSGNAEILGGRLDVAVVDGLRAGHLGRQYPMLEADGTVSGVFDDSHLKRLFIDMRAVRSESAFALSIERNATSFAGFGRTNNQRAVARAMDSQGYGGLAFGEVALIEDPSGLPGLYESLSGSIHASTRSALLDTGDMLKQSALQRARQGRYAGYSGGNAGQSLQTVPGSEHVLWGQGFGRWGRLDGNGEAGTLDRYTGGLVLGGDTAVGNQARAGLAVAHTDSRFDDNRSNRVRADGYHLAAYASSQQGTWALRGGMTQSWYQLDTRRRLGSVAHPSARSESRSQALQLFAEAGYGMELGTLRLEPYAGLSRAWLRQSGFSEDNAVFGLHADRSRDAVTFSTLGLRSGLVLQGENGRSIQMSAGLGWRHAFGNVRPARDLRFATGQSYSVVGAGLARNALLADVGLSWAAGQHGRIGFEYAGQIAGSTYEHAVQANLRWAF